MNDMKTTPHRRIILDVHTHHAPPQPEGIVACSPAEGGSAQVLPPAGEFPVQFFSVGVHPWDVKGVGLSPAQIAQLRECAARPDVVAIGETGIDCVRPGCAPMAGQLNALRAHVEISEELRKPLILHCVRGQEMIIAARRDMRPAMPWIIHGFRGKPSVAQMLLDAGCYLSFGVQFNAASLQAAPLDRILAETDDASCRIQDVIAGLQSARGDVTPDLLAANGRAIWQFP